MCRYYVENRSIERIIKTGDTMKKSKKLISIILSLAILIGVLTTVLVVTANAKETSISISVDKMELATGERATVSVNVISNYPIATMSIPIFYDKTLIAVSDATATLTDYAVNNAVIDTESVEPSKVYANTGLTDAKFGFVLVNYIGSAGSDVPESIDGTVLTFTITAKENVSGTAAAKCVAKSQKTDSNVEGMLYFGSPVSGRTIDAIPENVENIDITNAIQNVKISAGQIRLAVKENTTAVIDEENKYVYGITAGDNIEDYFIVTNGVMEIVPSSAGAENGTGAVINVKNNSGEILDSYTVIIFGDVNGDGAITAADSGVVELASVGATIDNKAYSVAADVNADGEITAADSGTVTLGSLGTQITVNPYA